jgi:flagellar biosynthesis protein FliR
MPATLLDYMALGPAFALVLARISGLVITAPLFGSVVLPRGAKVFLVFAITLAIFPAVLPTVPRSVAMRDALGGMLGELTIGAALGLGVQLVIVATQLAGSTVAVQSGMSFAQSVDPMGEGSGSDLGQVLYVLASLMFLAIGGHIELVRCLLDSFHRVPVMGLLGGESAFQFIEAQFVNCFALALRIAAPAVIALLLTALALGFASRTVPQLNILSVGLPLKIVVAVFVIMGTLPLFMPAVEESFAAVFESLGALLGAGSA